MIKRELEKYEGVEVYICDVEKGESIPDDISRHLEECHVVIIYGTETYGRKTQTYGISTWHEMTYILDENIPFFLFKMCGRFEETQTRLNFVGVAYQEWLSGGPTRKMIKKLLTKCATAAKVDVPGLKQRDTPATATSAGPQQALAKPKRKMKFQEAVHLARQQERKNAQCKSSPTEQAFAQASLRLGSVVAVGVGLLWYLWEQQ